MPFAPLRETENEQNVQRRNSINEKDSKLNKLKKN